MNWYWALTGWEWIVATVLGGITCLTAFFGMVVGIAKTIAYQAGPHNLRTCSCNKCQLVRSKAWNKREHPIVKRRNLPGEQVSTLQLNTGDIVLSRTTERYHVDQIMKREYGMVVRLHSLRNERKSWTTVPPGHEDVKMWTIAGSSPDRLIGL